MTSTDFAHVDVLPMCQDTGTAIVIGHKTETVLTGGSDAAALSHGVFQAYRATLRGLGTAACPVGVAVSCSADRQAKAKITPEGVFLEQLEQDPARYLPEVGEDDLSGEVVRIDLATSQPTLQIGFRR